MSTACPVTVALEFPFFSRSSAPSTLAWEEEAITTDAPFERAALATLYPIPISRHKYDQSTARAETIGKLDKPEEPPMTMTFLSCRSVFEVLMVKLNVEFSVEEVCSRCYSNIVSVNCFIRISLALSGVL